MISKQQGFSLLEVLISFVLLTVGIIGLVKLQVFFEKKSVYAATSIEALYAAEAKLEYFRTRSLNGGNGTLQFDSIITEQVPELINGYNVTWVVADKIPMLVSGATVTMLKEIKIKAEWNNNWNETQEVVLQTMISRHSEFD